MSEEQDKIWMRRALRLARRGWGTTSPNPMVGAIVVRDGICVGRGWHAVAGGPHAEVNALHQAGDQARGATIYVTLEPCSSYGRTPPCTDAILQAGIARVVMAMRDPDPRHCGRTKELLEAQGLEVCCGVEEMAAKELNAAFACRILHRRPLVLLKLAMTLDGRIATANGASKWITGPAARHRVQRLRRGCDAILVGAETIRCDNPSLLVREPADWARQPLRLILSRSGNLGEHPAVLHDGQGETRIVRNDGPTGLQEILQDLACNEQVNSLLIEGGGKVAAAFLNADLVDRIAFFVAPIILGGDHSRPAVGGPDPKSLSQAFRIEDLTIRRCGQDLLLTGKRKDVYRNC